MIRRYTFTSYRRTSTSLRLFSILKCWRNQCTTFSEFPTGLRLLGWYAPYWVIDADHHSKVCTVIVRIFHCSMPLSVRTSIWTFTGGTLQRLSASLSQCGAHQASKMWRCDGYHGNKRQLTCMDKSCTAYDYLVLLSLLFCNIIHLILLVHVPKHRVTSTWHCVCPFDFTLNFIDVFLMDRSISWTCWED